VAHEPANPEPKAPRIFYRFAFNDRRDFKDATKVLKLPKPNIKGNQAYLGYMFHVESELDGPFYVSPNPIPPIYFDPAPPTTRVWRDVSMDVTPTQVTATLDGKRSAALSIETATKRLQAEIPKHMKHVPDEPPVSSEFNAAGAMGLLIINGNATFKDVVVEILK